MSYSLWLGYILNHSNEDLGKKIEEDIDKSFSNYTNQDLYISWEQLTPSEIEGMSELEEKKVRVFSCGLIQEAGIHLKLPQSTILTAMSIFNRFFWRKSFQKYEPFHIAAASIFLACKAEETLKRLRDIASVFYHLFKKKERGSEKGKQEIHILDVSSDLYTQIKNNILVMELQILKELGFCLYELTNHPHKYLLYFIKNLKGTRDFLQKAWNYLNDAYRSSLVVNYSPNVLACSAIFLASRIYNFPLPYGIKWWEVYETSIDQIQEVCADILNLYEIGKIELREVREILKKHSPNIIIVEEKVEFIDKKRYREEYKRSKKTKKKKNKRKQSYSSSSSSSRYRRKKHKKRKKKYSSSESDSSPTYSSHYSNIRIPSPKFDK